MKSASDLLKDNLASISTCMPIGAIIPGPDNLFASRTDYEPEGKHKYVFYFSNAKGRRVHVVAPSEDMFMLWTQGFDCLKKFKASTKMII